MRLDDSFVEGSPVLLSDSGSASSALAWVSLDDACRLHYSLRIEGPDLPNNMESILGNSILAEDFKIGRGAKDFRCGTNSR